VVVFHPPAGALNEKCGVPKVRGRACPRPTPERSDASFMARVVAVGGDRFKVIDGVAYLDGHRLEESYVRPDPDCAACNLPREIAVPADHVFLMSDNRGVGADSRHWGPVPEAWITGAVVGKQ
jgi:signal peptidase I